jgi:UDPglucose 6-dehydrogenase
MSYSRTLTPNVAIMGTGMVGGALDRFLRSRRGIRAGLFDPPKGLDDPTVLAHADILFIAVPTPFDQRTGRFDDSYLRAALEAIPEDGKTIVIKSTVLPGTTDALQAAHPRQRFLFNPEFLTEATADWDMAHPNRQLVGYTSQSKHDAELVLSLLPDAPFQRTLPARDAETVKYFCNAFYALKVAYANQMYDLSQRIGVDYETVRDCVQVEPMMGTNHLRIFHQGYRGYGGKCLPKDTRAIIRLADEAGVELTLLKAAEAYNNQLQKAAPAPVVETSTSRLSRLSSSVFTPVPASR